jgi:hypothetical protein
LGLKQTTFLDEFADAFRDHFGPEIKWNGGQAFENTAALVTHVSGRRPVGVKKAERFELGDLTTRFRDWKIVVEFESRQIPISNILKYWPYLRSYP